MYSDEKEKVNILNNFFRDQTLLDDCNVELPEIIPYPVGHNLESITLSPDEVKCILKSLPVGKATGPDGVSNRILFALANGLFSPICDLFNQSLRQGDVSDCFKDSHVCPIHKGGDQSLPSNYRPISLLSNLEKSLERVVFKYFIITFVTTIFFHRFNQDLYQAILLSTNLLTYIITFAKLLTRVKTSE